MNLAREIQCIQKSGRDFIKTPQTKSCESKADRSTNFKSLISLHVLLKQLGQIDVISAIATDTLNTIVSNDAP